MPKESYIDRVKYFRDETGKWVLPKEVRITAEGRAIAESEPNISPDTLEQLLQTDWELLDDTQKGTIENKKYAAIAEAVFVTEGAGISLAHLSQCIKDNLDQSLGELIARYSIERQIPFVLGAVYVRALFETRGLIYFSGSLTGHRKIPWTPKEVYVAPEVEEPPKKAKRRVRRKPLEEKPKLPEYHITPCPVCGSPAKIRRGGKNYRLFHVCCDDPSGTCPNYIGLPLTKTEKMAAKDWAAYVAAYKKEHGDSESAAQGNGDNDSATTEPETNVQESAPVKHEGCTVVSEEVPA